MTVDTRDKQYQCDQCDKAFLKRSSNHKEKGKEKEVDCSLLGLLAHVD